MVETVRFINSLNEVHHGLVLERGEGEYSHLIRVFWDCFQRPSLKKQPLRLMPHISWVNPSGAIEGSQYVFKTSPPRWTIPELRQLCNGERVNFDKFLVTGGAE